MIKRVISIFILGLLMVGLLPMPANAGELNYTSSTDDGFLLEGNWKLGNWPSWDACHDDVSASYPVNNTGTSSFITVYTRKQIGSSLAMIERAYLYFNTSSIADGDTVIGATLCLYGGSNPVIGFGAFNLTLQDGGIYPSTPLVAGDYNYSHYSGDGGSLPSTNMADNTWCNLTLNAAGRSWVNKTGWTTFCLREKDHDVDDVYPSYHTSPKYNQWKWDSAEAGSTAPRLLITYTTSTAPTISTNAATQVKMTTARLNSYLTDDGGELCDVRFRFNASGGAPYTNATPWVNDTYATGNSPYADITDLAANTTYYFIVQGNNSAGLANGTELSFTTTEDIFPPTELKAYPTSHSIGLVWIKGIGSTSTIVRAQIGSYPANYTDGDSVYSGIQSTATHADLIPGTCYYFKAWGRSGGNYSSTNITLMATTYAGADEGDSPAAPTTPSNWWGSPDYEKLSNLAGYDLVNSLADAYEIPRNTMWLMIILGLIMAMGLFIYSVSHSTIGALILVGVFITMASIAQLLPLWFIAAYCIPLVSMMMIQRRA